MWYQFKNLISKSDFGLVIDWKFHCRGGWVSSFSKYLVAAILDEFSPIIITSQADYDKYKKRIKYLVSMEPGWAAPKLIYDTKQVCKKAVFYSDPHFKTEERRSYFLQNQFDYVYSFYREPFFYHFVDFPESRFVHFPWAVPDRFIDNHELKVKNECQIAIFGGKKSDAYDMRNWCRQQKGITNFSNSGVENKVMTDEEYYQWLAGFDAIVAAGSTDPKYDMITPKYFEVMGAGSLLIGQHCRDFDHIGFNQNNMLTFSTKNEFLEKVRDYKNNPEGFLIIRKNGRDHIQKKHTISKRIQLIKRSMYGTSKAY